MKLIRDNKKARFEFSLFEKFEAGIKLEGTEVKSIREGRVSLNESYCRFREGQLYVINMDIGQYQPAGKLNHEPKRARKLLLHKYELDRLYGKMKSRNVTIIPLRMYFNEKGLVKLEIALASRVKKHDKREKLMEKEVQKRLRRYK